MIHSTLIYIEKDGCYLMLHRVRKKNDLNKDKWIGVGGKFEPGEDARACAAREMFEETGLTARKLDFRGVIDFDSSLYESEEIHLFTCTEFEGELHECDEGTLEWVPLTQIPTLHLWEGDMLFLTKLMRGERNFRMRLRYEGDTLVFHETIENAF